MLLINGFGRIFTPDGRIDITNYLSRVELRSGSLGALEMQAELIGVTSDDYFGKPDPPGGPLRIIFTWPNQIMVPLTPPVDIRPFCENVSIRSNYHQTELSNMFEWNHGPNYEITILAMVLQEPAVPTAPSVPATEKTLPEVVHPHVPDPVAKPEEPKNKPEIGEAILADDEEMFP